MKNKFFKDTWLGIHDDDSRFYRQIKNNRIVSEVRLNRVFFHIWKLDSESWGSFKPNMDFKKIWGPYHWLKR